MFYTVYVVVAGPAAAFKSAIHPPPRAPLQVSETINFFCQVMDAFKNPVDAVEDMEPTVTARFKSSAGEGDTTVAMEIVDRKLWQAEETTPKVWLVAVKLRLKLEGNSAKGFVDVSIPSVSNKTGQTKKAF